MSGDFVHLHCCVSVARPPNVGHDRVRQSDSLRVREAVGSDTAVWDHRIVAERAGLRQVVDRVPQVGWDRIRHDRGVLDHNLLLIRIERTDQVEADTGLDVEHSNSGETTSSTFARLGTHEDRRHRHFVADDDAIDGQMVPVELESPRHIRSRHAKEGHEIWPFAEIICPASQLCKQIVEAHDVASLRIAPSRQRDAEQVEECVPLKGRQFLEHDPVSIHVDVWVEPCPPLVRLKRKAQARARRCLQQVQKSRGCLPDRFGR